MLRPIDFLHPNDFLIIWLSNLLIFHIALTWLMLVFSGVRVTRSLVLCVCFVDRCFSFVLLHLTIVLSVLLRCTDSDYYHGIFKLFYFIYLCFNNILPWCRIKWFCKIWNALTADVLDSHNLQSINHVTASFPIKQFL